MSIKFNFDLKNEFETGNLSFCFEDFLDRKVNAKYCCFDDVI